MTTFCYDHYEHPLLWCEEKKRLIEKRNAEESMRIWRRKKAEEIARRERDKQEYYEMYLKHCPWGRPGGGAPNVDIRRRDITAIGLHSTPTISTMHRITSMQPQCRFSDYFLPKKCRQPHITLEEHHNHHHHNHGCHQSNCENISGPCNGMTICEKTIAPVSHGCKDSVDGGEQLQITVKDHHHPSYSHRNKNHVDIEVRYKPPAAVARRSKPKLEKITTTSENDQQEKPIEFNTSPKKKLKTRFVNIQQNKDTSDKMGDKMCKNPKSLGSTFMKSLGWTNKEMMKELDQDNPATPAEKPIARKTKKKVEKSCNVCDCKCRVQGGAISCAALKPSSDCKLNEDKCMAKALCPRLGRHCLVQSHLLPNEGVELVPLLARRRAQIRPISLSSTDVTRRTAKAGPAAGCDNRFTPIDPRYLNDLNSQISQKRRSVSLSQQLDRELSSKHFETFDKFWGRPGHGAPSQVKTKLKLDDLLYGVQPSSAQ